MTEYTFLKKVFHTQECPKSRFNTLLRKSLNEDFRYNVLLKTNFSTSCKKLFRRVFYFSRMITSQLLKKCLRILYEMYALLYRKKEKEKLSHV